MQVRFMLGPAGSGKTFRCLEEIRAALTKAPEGPPLLLIAPRQTTYQLERQLLASPDLPGYTRLQILSFERLAQFVLKELRRPPPRLLDEEGRVMVLRNLLSRKRGALKLFRAGARLSAFAAELSRVLRELQRQQLNPESLRGLAEKAPARTALNGKLHDFADLLEDYERWLASHQLQDAECLLEIATGALRAPHEALPLAGVWVDGFTEISPRELDLLAELLPAAQAACVSFCLEAAPDREISWLDHWSVCQRMFRECRAKFSRLAQCEISFEVLRRNAEQSRFRSSAALRHLESNWSRPEVAPRAALTPDEMAKSIRVAMCGDREGEVTTAAREILQFVREGGRYREITVLARRLEDYHALLANIFARYEIPFFLDRREPAAHHPLAELTRSALRVVTGDWRHEHWFAALKTGLVRAADGEIDRLENEALARGWKGLTWLRPISIAGEPELERWVEEIRRKIVPPFNQFALALKRQGNQPNGPQLAEALRNFWESLRVEEALQSWSDESAENAAFHLTVWDQMNAWLDNVANAFADESIALREWLSILDAGLAGLTVGVIPPALDQVFLGAIDRSRNPDIRLAIILGMNESVFPAPPEPSALLNETDREELESHGLSLLNFRQQLGRERFYCYVACTRARERMLLTSALAGSDGEELNPSPFLSHLKRIVPGLEFEAAPRAPDWRQSEHVSELIAPLLTQRDETTIDPALARLAELPALAALNEQLRHLVAPSESESLSPNLAASLYGPALRTSVSRMEQFAACPFKFFVHSGLRAQERKLFELDVRSQGNFQHEVLAAFHEQLRRDGKRWRDITPEEARDRIQTLAAASAVTFEEGLLQSSEESKFTARMLTASLQDFVEVLVIWMRRQYAFDPVEVELPFGDENRPPWKLVLGGGNELQLHGRIDRVDLYKMPGEDKALCVVVDYKSSQKQLDPAMLANGLQLQLPAYLSVLRSWPEARKLFGVRELLPAGVFYVNLRGKYARGGNRDEVLDDAPSVRLAAYQHAGRFDANQIRKLDTRMDAVKGDQFNYKVNKDGSISKTSRDAMDPAEFLDLLDGVEANLMRMGRAVYAGEAGVDPYRKGSLTACEQCDYHSICRIDPSTHSYRFIHKEADKPASSGQD